MLRCRHLHDPHNTLTCSDMTDFLDSFELVATGLVEHRGVHARQTAAAKQFDRNWRPGCIKRDVDYGENYTIEEAKLIQSEHWSKSLLILITTTTDYMCNHSIS